MLYLDGYVTELQTQCFGNNDKHYGNKEIPYTCIYIIFESVFMNI